MLFLFYIAITSISLNINVIRRKFQECIGTKINYISIQGVPWSSQEKLLKRSKAQYGIASTIYVEGSLRML